MPTNFVDDLRVVESLYVHQINDPHLESSAPILVENISVSYAVAGDIINNLVVSNTHTPTDIHVYKESTSNQDVLVESSMPPHI